MSTHNSDESPLQNVQSAISQSAQMSQLHIGFIPSPSDGSTIDYPTLRKAFDDIPALLDNWEDAIVAQTEKLLIENERSPTGDLDGIFVFHTNYVEFCVKAFLAQRARRLWREQIAPLVDAYEARLRMVNPNASIHRGAPLYNVALCSFVLGDFDRAVQFMAEAGSNDEKLGRGSKFKILIGDGPLSRQIIIDPLNAFLKSWGSDYIAVTGTPLDENELVSLLNILADRPADALQVVVALHRICRSGAKPQNHATNVIRFRALGELLHVIESFLRHFQTGVQGELGKHLTQLLTANPIVQTAKTNFQTQWNTWVTSTGCDRHSVQAMDWLAIETAKGISSASSPAVAAGIVTLFCHQFRNSLLHVNEENLLVFQDKNHCVAAAGWVLAMLRVCARAKQGKFTLADFA